MAQLPAEVHDTEKTWPSPFLFSEARLGTPAAWRLDCAVSGLWSGLAEEGQLFQKLAGGGDEGEGVIDGLVGFAGCCGFARDVGVFELVSAAAHGVVGAEAWSELGLDCGGHGGVAAAGGGAESLLGEQGGAGEPGGS